MKKSSTKSTVVTGKIDVRFRSSSLTPFEADQRFGKLLFDLITYRRTDEAAGHRFTRTDGQVIPALPSQSQSSQLTTEASHAASA